MCWSFKESEVVIDSGFVAISAGSDTSVHAGEAWLWGWSRAGGIPGEPRAPCRPWTCYRLPATGLGDHQVVCTIGPLLEISHFKEAKYERKARMRVGARSVVMRVRTRSVAMGKICQTRGI